MRPVLPALALAALFAATAQADELPLTKVTISQSQFRPGFGVEGEIPTEALKFADGSRSYLLLDLDRDGVFTPIKDGLALQGHPFVVRLPAQLLFADGQFAISVNGAKLVREAQPLPVAKDLLAQAADFTELRVRCGQMPVKLDADLCRACEKHCDYLKLNPTSGLGYHHEHPSGRGYTPEGDAAGQGSCIHPGSPGFRESLWGFWAGPWHAIPMIDPTALRYGIALKNGIAMIYLPDRVPLDADVVHPADGAVKVPPHFAENGESPNPVPGTQGAAGCGFPIFAQLKSEVHASKIAEFKVSDTAGAAVKGTVSCPAQPANAEWPSNSGLAVFIPSAPLKPNETYRVRLLMEGMTSPLEWAFSTGDKILPVKADAEVAKKLAKKIGALDLKEDTFEALAKRVASSAGVAIKIQPATKESLKDCAPAAFKSPSGTPAEKVLKQLCEQFGLSFQVKEGAVWISGAGTNKPG